MGVATDEFERYALELAAECALARPGETSRELVWHLRLMAR